MVTQSVNLYFGVSNVQMARLKVVLLNLHMVAHQVAHPLYPFHPEIHSVPQTQQEIVTAHQILVLLVYPKQSQLHMDHLNQLLTPLTLNPVLILMVLLRQLPSQILTAMGLHKQLPKLILTVMAHPKLLWHQFKIHMDLHNPL